MAQVGEVQGVQAVAQKGIGDDEWAVVIVGRKPVVELGESTRTKEDGARAVKDYEIGRASCRERV